MGHGKLRAAAYAIAFAALHSLLATRASKRAARRWLGPRPADGLYRVAYNAIALLTFAALVGGLRRLPQRELYRAGGPLRAALLFAQLALCGLCFDVLRRLGPGEFAGWTHLQAFLSRRHRDRAPAHSPERQFLPLPALWGEVQAPHPSLVTNGPFRYVRHPLNSAVAVLLFLTPRMTDLRLLLACLSLLYAIVGSAHEEARLLEEFGDSYRRYMERVPFLVPSLRVRLQPVTTRRH